ncbi:hypothetical protein MJM99_32955, partial [Salmonella enterica subsp. enterica serovar Kentucky]|nr:hypothetical protein [Salmonella enterica subsp. enterica serovar Kentucky]
MDGGKTWFNATQSSTSGVWEVKTSAIGSLALASSAFTLPFSRIAHAAAGLASGNVAEKAVWS